MLKVGVNSGALEELTKRIEGLSSMSLALFSAMFETPNSADTYSEAFHFLASELIKCSKTMKELSAGALPCQNPAYSKRDEAAKK